MNHDSRIMALLLSAVLVVGVVGPAVAGTVGAATAGNTSLSVSVSQSDTGEATVMVTEGENNTSVEGASVTVETIDNNTSYEGTGTYTTDANGTVSLPAPNETVNVSVTASHDNMTASTTATLEPASDDEEDGNATAFGLRVSNFVHQLQDTNNSSDAPFGAQVAAFVVANNPGNAPDHAGPPEWLLNDSVNKTTGPPDHAGPDENKTGGPPDDKGNDKDNGGDPPDHAGQDDDGDDEEEDSDE